MRHADARAPSVALVEKRDCGLGREHAGQIVRDGDPRSNGGSIRLSGEVEKSAVGDAVAIEARSQRLGSVLPEHAYPYRDQARVELRGVDVPALERAGPEVLANDVRGGGQIPKDGLALFPAQIQGDRLPAPSLHCPVQRVRTVVGVDEGTEITERVTALRLLDLDDLGTLLTEDARAKWRGDPSAEIEDA